MQHPSDSSPYMTEIPFQPLWAPETQPPHPPIMPYPDLITGFPCPDLGKFTVFFIAIY